MGASLNQISCHDFPSYSRLSPRQQIKLFSFSTIKFFQPTSSPAPVLAVEGEMESGWGDMKDVILITTCISQGDERLLLDNSEKAFSLSADCDETFSISKAPLFLTGKWPRPLVTDAYYYDIKNDFNCLKMLLRRFYHSPSFLKYFSADGKCCKHFYSFIKKKKK